MLVSQDSPETASQIFGEMQGAVAVVLDLTAALSGVRLEIERREAEAVARRSG